MARDIKIKKDKTITASIRIDSKIWRSLTEIAKKQKVSKNSLISAILCDAVESGINLVEEISEFTDAEIAEAAELRKKNGGCMMVPEVEELSTIIRKNTYYEAVKHSIETNKPLHVVIDSLILKGLKNQPPEPSALEDYFSIIKKRGGKISFMHDGFLIRMESVDEK